MNHDSLIYGKSHACSECGAARAAVINTKHGHAGSRRASISPEYKAWVHAIGRCENPSDKGYYRYGARGIAMCSAWRESFELFLADVGRRPSPLYSLDRIDNDGNYEPGNCRWATKAEQRRNQARVRLTADDVRAIRAARNAGESQASIAKRHGLPKYVVYSVVGRKSYKDIA